MRNFILLALALFACPLLCCQTVQQGITIGTCLQNGCGPTLTGLAILPASPSVVKGQTLQMRAAGVESDGTNGGVYTPACDNNWTSATPSVLTISSTGLVTAVNTGTSVVSCQLPSNTSIAGSTTVTVVGAPNITFPVCPPCTLPAGTNGTAYSQTMAATGGVLPYTWNCNGSCAGLLPTGLSLSSGGVLSGTPTVNGTTTWTLKVTDNAAATASVSVSLTISGTVLGPPTYLGSTNSTADPGSITPYFTSSSPQNSTAYDPTLNPTTDCIALATTGSSSAGGQSQAGSFSGGANGHDWSWDETMLAFGNVGGGWSIIGVTTNGSGCPQVTNTGVPAWTGLGKVAFDWFTAAGKTNHDIYTLTSGHIIQKATVSNLASMGSFTTIGDYANCPGPLPATFIHGSIWTPVSGSSGGLRFMQSIGPGGQGTATSVYVYDTTLGCTSVDMNNGFYYPWCTVSCASEAGIALSTTGNYCYGFSSTTDAIHDGQPSGDGTIFRMSTTSNGSHLTHGVCAGIVAGGAITWTVGTGTVTYSNGATSTSPLCPSGVHCEYGGHPSEGFSNGIANAGGLSFNKRPLSNISGAFTYVAPNLSAFARVGPQDNHGAWPMTNSPDTFPMWVGMTDLILNTTPSPCSPTNANNCPPYLSQVGFALPIDGSNAVPRLFVHNHSCGGQSIYWLCPDGGDSYFYDYDAVPSVSPQGNYMSFPSTDLHSFGLDGSGKFRSNILIVRLQ